MSAFRFASVAAILLFLASPVSAKEGDGIVTKMSSHGVAETVDRLEAALKEKGLTVFARIDHAAWRLQGAITHAKAILAHHDGLALRRQCDHIDPVEGFEHQSLKDPPTRWVLHPVKAGFE